MSDPRERLHGLIEKFAQATRRISIVATTASHKDLVDDAASRMTDVFSSVLRVDLKEAVRRNIPPWSLVAPEIGNFDAFLRWARSLERSTLLVLFNLREGVREAIFSTLHSGLDDLAIQCPNLRIVFLDKSYVQLSEHLRHFYQDGSDVLSYCEPQQVVNLDDEPATDAFDIAIICALRTPELAKVLCTGKLPWKKLEQEHTDPATYHAGVYVTRKGRELRVVAAAPNQMGMPATAILATKMVMRFSPKLVAMVGIAAGMKGDTQGMGDLLAPDMTLDYGAGKISSHDDKVHFSPDPNPIGIVPILRNRLKDWALDHSRLSQIRASWIASPPRTALQLHVGPLGSGAAVVSSAATADEIRQHWRKLVGIEMEAYGAHLACQEARNPPPMFLCVKSICDFADPNKGDDWQHYAAYTAAQFCYLFLTEEWEPLFPSG